MSATPTARFYVTPEAIGTYASPGDLIINTAASTQRILVGGGANAADAAVTITSDGTVSTKTVNAPKVMSSVITLSLGDYVESAGGMHAASVTGSTSTSTNAAMSVDASDALTLIPVAGASVLKNARTGLRAKWGVAVDGPSSEDPADVGVDPSGDVLLAGMYSATAAVRAPDGSPVSLPALAGGASGTFVVKCAAATGAVVWAAAVTGSSAGDSWGGMRVDAAGNVYVLCNKEGAAPAVVYDATGTPSATVTVPVVAGARSFVVKYGADGGAKWAVSTDAVAMGVAADGNVALAGAGGVSKYGADGVRQWTTGVSGMSVMSVRAVALDAVYGVRVACATSGADTQVSFDGANGAAVPAGSSYVVSLSTSGAGLWVASCTAQDVSGVAMDPTTGDAVIACSRRGAGAGGAPVPAVTVLNAGGAVSAVTLGPTQYNVQAGVLVRFNAAGAALWLARQDAPSSSAGGGFAMASRVSIDVSGRVCVAGYFEQAPLAAYSSDGTELMAHLPVPGPRPTCGVYAVRYTVAGVADWVLGVASSNFNAACGVCTGPTGDVYLATYVAGDPVVAASITNPDGTSGASAPPRLPALGPNTQDKAYVFRFTPALPAYKLPVAPATTEGITKVLLNASLTDPATVDVIASDGSTTASLDVPAGCARSLVAYGARWFPC